MENFIFCAVIYLCMPEIFLVDKKTHVKVVQLSPLDKTHTAQKMKFSIKDFFSKCDKIRRKLRVWSHLLKKSLIENFIFSVVCKPRYKKMLWILKMVITSFWRRI